MEKELVCIDTNICVDFLRAKGPGYALFIKLLEKYEPCVTAITAFELYLGHMKMKRRDKIADFIAGWIGGDSDQLLFALQRC